MKDEPLDAAGPDDPATPAAAPERGAVGRATRDHAPVRLPTRLTEIGARRFLDELAGIGSVFEAARRARTPRASLYRRRDRDPEFAAAWDEALKRAVDRLQDEAMLRAIEGIERPVFYRGEQVAAVRQTSDRLLMFLLRAHRRELYDPNYVKPWVSPERDDDAGSAGSLDALLRGLGTWPP
jgi:hypothetical protein